MDHTKLTQSLEDYLEMVHMLRLANGLARVKDIAAALGVKMPSVAKAMVELKKMGLVRQEPYSGVELTEEGERVAAMILNRHILLKGFLIKLISALGLEKESKMKASASTSTRTSQK